MTLDATIHQGPLTEKRDDRSYAVSQFVTPGGVAAVNANAPAELIFSMYEATIAAWKVA